MLQVEKWQNKRELILRERVFRDNLNTSKTKATAGSSRFRVKGEFFRNLVYTSPRLSDSLIVYDVKWDVYPFDEKFIKFYLQRLTK